MTDSQFAYWLAGFCDGEAHFSVTLATSSTGRVAGSPRFNLTLREDDGPVLEMAQERLGVGKLRHISNARARSLGKRDRDAIAWEVTGPSCAVVAKTLQGKMQSKKRAEFDVWAPAVLQSASMPRYDSRRAPLLIEVRNQLLSLRSA